MFARCTNAHAATARRRTRRPRYSVSRHVLPGALAAFCIAMLPAATTAQTTDDATLLLADARTDVAAEQAAPVVASTEDAAAWLEQGRGDAPPTTPPARLGGVLFLGAGFVAAIGFVLQRRRKLGVGGNAPIRHLQSVRLGARQQVTLVEIDGRRLLLGVSDKDIRLLGDLAASVEKSAGLELHDVLAAVDNTPTPQALPAAPTSEPSIDLDTGERVELSAAARSTFTDPLEAAAPKAPASDAPAWDDAFAQALDAAAPIVEDPLDAWSNTRDEVQLQTMQPPAASQEERVYPPPRRFARVVGTPDDPQGNPSLAAPDEPWTPSRRTSLLADLAPEEQRSLRAGGEPRLDSNLSSERAGVMAGLASLRTRSIAR